VKLAWQAAGAAAAAAAAAFAADVAGLQESEVWHVLLRPVSAAGDHFFQMVCFF